MNNIATAQFSDSVYTVSTPLWRYDYGQVLKIEGLPLPDPFEVHFSYAPVGTAKYQIGRNGQVTIPDEFLTKSGFAYAWIFLHTGEDDGETRYQIKIPVRERAKPTDTPLTPEEQSVVTQLIAVLNDKVEEAQDAADQAEEAQLHYPMVGTNGNWFVWDVNSGSWVDTGVHAQGEQGIQGIQGPKGDKGDTGRQGGAMIGVTIDDDGYGINEINLSTGTWNGGVY